jgi:hypothetical protein
MLVKGFRTPPAAEATTVEPAPAVEAELVDALA